MATTKVIIDDKIPPAVRSKVSLWFSNGPSRERVSVYPISRGVTDLGDITGLCAALISAINLVVYLHQSLKEKRGNDSWSRDRLISFINEEMTDNGVSEFNIDKIVNYSSLKVGGDEPCRVYLSNKKNKERYIVFVFNKEDGFTISLDP